MKKYNSHKREFRAWKERQEKEFGREFFDKLSEVDPTAQGDEDLQVGDIVEYTNDYGVIFAPREVVGFSVDVYNCGRVIFLDFECFWAPTRRRNVKKINLKK